LIGLDKRLEGFKKGVFLLFGAMIHTRIQNQS
jgi:hypothetical protein